MTTVNKSVSVVQSGTEDIFCKDFIMECGYITVQMLYDLEPRFIRGAS